MPVFLIERFYLSLATETSVDEAKTKKGAYLTRTNPDRPIDKKPV